RRATIIDVAVSAGVSKTTVARVLAGESNVDPDTRRRVERALSATGYERNQLARSLRTGRSHTLGLVIPDIANPYWADVARGAQDAAEREGWSVLVVNSDWDAARETRHLAALRQSRVDAVIVNPVGATSDPLAVLGLPAVLIGSGGEDFPHHSSVRSNIHQGLQLAMSHLRRHEHDAPALLVGRSRPAARERFLGVVHDVCRQQGVDPEALPVEDADYSMAAGHAAMRRLLARPARERPSAVLAHNDLMALGALAALREAGVDCPREVSVMGVDGIAAAALTAPGLTTIEKPRYAIGAEAAALAVEHVCGRREPRHVVLPCRLIERGSVASRSSVASIPATATA
ncbi:MAG: LacI family transcriptional regulator, partial [Alphaproteobacteria bacterium]|nr:LacI family transcriptional regulator [Alphaproteobacteria bacterium]